MRFIDLLVTRDCLPRRRLADDELTALSHAPAFYLRIHEEALLDDLSPSPPPGDMLLIGVPGKAASLGDLREQLREHWPLLTECIGCPCNLTAFPVGCHIPIQVPIALFAEQDLAEAASAAAKRSETAEALLRRTPVATPRFRLPSAGLFQSPSAPLVRLPWQGEATGVPLDAFWDMLFAPRDQSDLQALMDVLSQCRPDKEMDPEREADLLPTELLRAGIRLALEQEVCGGYVVRGC